MAQVQAVCDKCGASLVPNAAYCERCGERTRARGDWSGSRFGSSCSSSWWWSPWWSGSPGSTRASA